MPTYTYDCTKCGTIEIWQSIHDGSLTGHSCGGELTKVFTPPRISAYAMPNKNQEPVQIDHKNSQLSRDLAAYKRLRRDGTQPPRVDGSAHLEAHAETRDEIERGRIFPAEYRERVTEAKQFLVESGMREA